MADILNIGITGLKAQKKALTVTGHNIANANTPGYSRQRVVFNENNPQFIGGHWMGTGTRVDTIQRIHDRFLTQQYRTDTSTFNQLQNLAENAGQVDSLLADAGTGIQPALKKSFSALQASIDDPSSLPARAVFLSESKGLVERFKSIYGRLNEQNKILNGQMSVMIGQINAYSKAIADLNSEIQMAYGSGGEQQAPNDLLDQRDKILKDLSALVRIRVVEQPDKTVNVSIGNGQSLVLGKDFNKLHIDRGQWDPSRHDIYFKLNGRVENISTQIEGGKLGGIMRFRSQVLDPAMNALGRMALTINQTMNEQHHKGVDYNSLKGRDFYTKINTPERTYQRVLGSRNNASPNDRIISVHIQDAGKLSTSDYRLEFTGPDSKTFQLRRASDDKVVLKSALTNDFPQKINVDGMEIRLEGGSFQKGDRFLILPTRTGASNIEVQLSRPEQIALASPISTEKNLSNTGNASISPGKIYDIHTETFKEEGKLSPPILIRFTSPSTYDVLDNSDPSKPIPLFPPLMNQRFVPGLTNQILPKDEGKRAFTSYGGFLPPQPVYQPPPPATEVHPVNNFASERIKISKINPETGQKYQQPVLETSANTSAKETARLISQRDGVKAVARTTVQVSNFKHDSNGFIGMNFKVNGVDMTDTLGSNQTKYANGYPAQVPNPVTPNFIADRINANYQFREQGIIAKSDGNTLTIIALKGDDVQLELSGDYEDSVKVSNGQSIALKATGKQPFTPLVASSSSAYDFTKGGPYTYEFHVPGQGDFSITLDKKYANGQSAVDAIKQKIEDAGFTKYGDIDVKVSEKGEISFQSKLELKATGPNGSRKINMGGQVKVIVDKGYNLEIEPPGNNLFKAKPEGKPVHLGFSVDITGTVAKGDEFTVKFNQNGKSDSRNGNEMSALERKKVIGGNMSYSESYAKMVEEVGSITNRAKINRDSSKALLANTEKSLLSLSGVNLDEEAGKLIQHQLAYRASAQIIKAAQEMFDTLIGTFR